MPNILSIGQTFAKICRFFHFPIRRLSAILDLWCAWLAHPRRALGGGLYHCAKFGWNRCSNFDNMHVFDFVSLAWKWLFRPQNWSFGDSNDTLAPIANPPNSAQLGAVSTTHPSYIQVRAVMFAAADRHTHRHTQTRMITIHFASSTTHAKCNYTVNDITFIDR